MRPSALTLLATVIVVVAIFMSVRGYPPPDHWGNLFFSGLDQVAAQALDGDEMPRDFVLSRATPAYDLDASDLGGDWTLGEAVYDSQDRQQTISIVVRAATGWPNISDSRGLLVLGEPVDDLSAELCSVVGTEDTSSWVLTGVEIGDGGWHLECASASDSLLAMDVDVTYAGLLVAETLVTAEVMAFASPQLATSPPIDSESIATDVLRQFGQSP